MWKWLHFHWIGTAVSVINPVGQDWKFYPVTHKLHFFILYSKSLSILFFKSDIFFYKAPAYTLTRLINSTSMEGFVIKVSRSPKQKPLNRVAIKGWASRKWLFTLGLVLGVCLKTGRNCWLMHVTKSGPSLLKRKNTRPHSAQTPPPGLMDSTWDSGLCQPALKKHTNI